MIMEGERRIDGWEECLRLRAVRCVVLRVYSHSSADKIRLAVHVGKSLFLVNGQCTLEELCRDTESNAFQVYRIVYGLVANKLIEPATPPSEEIDAPTGPVAPLQTTVDDFGGDSTVRELADDTSLLVNEEATLSFKDVIRKTVAQLLIMGGEGAGTVVPLVENEYGIGRQRDNRIQLNDLGVSSHHARIFRGPDGYVVEDLKSRNGTWVNGKRIVHSILKNADEIRVGATDLRFEVLFDATAEPTAIKAR